MPPPVVALDANVLIAALLAPHGACRRLLDLAVLGIFRPVITGEVLAEVERNCRLGIGGRVITDGEIHAFRAAIAPLLEPVNLAPSPVGRAASEHAPLVNVDNKAIFQHDPGGTGHPRGQQRQTEVVNDVQALMRDMGDAHLLAAAVHHCCDYLCTANGQDFPEGFVFQGTRSISPGHLLDLLLQEDDGPMDEE